MPVTQTQKINPLTYEQLRFFSALMPAPHRQYTIDNVSYDVFCVKRAHDITRDEIAWRFVLEARHSYLRYGDVPLSDNYDPKSVVYLVRAKYVHVEQAVQIPVEEWLSVRFVPSDGLPQLSEDLQTCTVDGESLGRVLGTKLAKKDAVAVSISRLCAIRPYSTGGLQQNFPHQLHAGISFALANKAFIEDHIGVSQSVALFTMMSCTSLVEKVLCFESSEKTIYLRPHLVQELLGEGAQITLNRNVLSYKYPRYFLANDSLLALISHLVDHGVLSRETIETYLQVSLSPEQLMALIQTDKSFARALLTDLGSLFTCTGRVAGTSITGDQLRSLIDQYVPDLPQVYAMPTALWKQELRRFLKAVHKATQVQIDISYQQSHVPPRLQTNSS